MNQTNQDSTPNFPRHVPELKGAYVPLIVRPLKLPKHTEYVVSSKDFGRLPFCAGMHKLGAKRVVLIHRKTAIQSLLEEQFGV